MDLTAKLPDEILIQVLHHLPSLRDKLRVESVSRRYQRCLIELLNTRPQPFELTTWKKRLNGYKLHQRQLLGAVQTLARKAKFCSIFIDFRKQEELDSILSALVNSSNDCLAKVATVHIKTLSGTVTQSLLQQAIAKCHKVSVVNLDFQICPSDSERDVLNLFCPMDLGAVLNDKALTELCIWLEGHTQGQLIQLFKSIKPNKLTKIQLKLHRMTLKIDALVNELSAGAWMALEVIHLECSEVHLQMAQLFSLGLPKLRKCNLKLSDIEPKNQLVDALKSLFASNVETTVYYSDGSVLPHGCHMVALLRQVQATYPDLEVGFRFSSLIPTLTLTLGKVIFEHGFTDDGWPEHCFNDNCDQCGIFYPTVISLLNLRNYGLMVGMQQDAHLADCRLDRCRIGSVVEHLNHHITYMEVPVDYEHEIASPLSAELNDAHDLATITFEPKVAGVAQFQITVDCGHCLNDSCIGCVDVG